MTTSTHADQAESKRIIHPTDTPDLVHVSKEFLQRPTLECVQQLALDRTREMIFTVCTSHKQFIVNLTRVSISEVKAFRPSSQSLKPELGESEGKHVQHPSESSESKRKAVPVLLGIPIRLIARSVLSCWAYEPQQIYNENEVNVENILN